MINLDVVQKGIEKLRELKNQETFVMDEKHSKNINGEYLFMKAASISKFIRFEVGEAFLLLLAHDRRHLYSIKEIMTKLNY